jgi:hypothetical protein
VRDHLRVDHPSIGDVRAVVETVRRRGSVYYPLDALSGDFATWRRRIWAEADRAGVRVSVRRVNQLVLVYDPDRDPPDGLLDAVADLTDELLTGERLDHEQASRNEGRPRLRIVRDDEMPGGQHGPTADYDGDLV